MHTKHALSFKGSLLWPPYIATDITYMINAPSLFLHTASDQKLEVRKARDEARSLFCSASVQYDWDEPIMWTYVYKYLIVTLHTVIILIER